MRKIEVKTTAMKLVEVVTKKELEKLLHDLYIEKGMSIREIGLELDVHYHTVNRWLTLAGIQTRLPHQRILEMVELRRKLNENKRNDKEVR